MRRELKTKLRQRNADLQVQSNTSEVSDKREKDTMGNTCRDNTGSDSVEKKYMAL